MSNQFSLMIHGGAGNLSHLAKKRKNECCLDAIRSVLENGRNILADGGAALETVEACVARLEDDPLFNAGRGSVLNEAGKVEMDAAIMDGRDLRAGSVAGLSGIVNPIKLARCLLERNEHVMLIGEGALRFAKQCGFELAVEEYFFTDERIEQFKKVHAENNLVLDHSYTSEGFNKGEKYGTVGAVAYDLFGNLAAATSTGGMVNKRIGRVGDSPIIGSGVYADNETAAVSATGYGEDIIRTVLSKTIADIIRFQRSDANEAAKLGIDYFSKKIGGRGGIIVIDKAGICASRFTTKNMIHGWIEKGGKSNCTI